MRTVLLIALAGIFLWTASPAQAGPIYVFTERDGTIRFTDRQPPASVKAQVFTGRGTTFSKFGGASRSRGAGRSKQLFPKEYEDIITRAAASHRLDPHLIRAVIHVESAFNPHAVSPKGARGLMQLMPGTARDLGVLNSFDPRQNINGGTKYLSYLLGRFSGNVRYALAAYNAGEQNVNKYQGIPPYTETIDYVQRVLAMKTRYQQSVAKG